MLLLIEKILALVSFNGAFSRTIRQVAVSVLVLKMITRASNAADIATLRSSPKHAATSSATRASRDSHRVPTTRASAEFLWR